MEDNNDESTFYKFIANILDRPFIGYKMNPLVFTNTEDIITNNIVYCRKK